MRNAQGLPSWLYWSEPARAFADYGLFLAAYPLMAQLPRGDGHPVLVLPGLLAGDESTAVLRAMLQRMGYVADAWTLGRNVGPSDESGRAMRKQLKELNVSHGASVSVIGCSMGGLYARKLARDLPGAVRQVITLGTPLRLERSADSSTANADRTQPASKPGRPRSTRERWGPAVPCTSIYSPLDGVVDWRSCVDDPGERRENVAVAASHCGMGHHPASLWVVADRLAQAEGAWRPFQTPVSWQGAFSAPTCSMLQRRAPA